MLTEKLEWLEHEWRRRLDCDEFYAYVRPELGSMKLYETVAAGGDSTEAQREDLYNAARLEFLKKLRGLREELNALDLEG